MSLFCVGFTVVYLSL